jgi:AraC-like DNA-binding protein
VRHEQAAEQLRRTERPIKKIALAVGFRNEKSFSRAFRAWAGVTPGAFRRAGATVATHGLPGEDNS